MAGTGTKKAKSADLEAREEERDEGRRSSERNEEQEVNQGMDTGTHDSTRRGVDWGASYRKQTSGGTTKNSDEPKATKTPRTRKSDSSSG